MRLAAGRVRTHDQQGQMNDNPEPIPHHRAVTYKNCLNQQKTKVINKNEYNEQTAVKNKKIKKNNVN